MTGDSKWDCPQCHCKRDATKRLVIWRLPPILLVILKRSVKSASGYDDDDDDVSLLVTNANVKKRKRKKKHPKTNHILRLTIRKNEISIGEKFLQKHGKDVTMSSRTQTTEILLRWKYLRRAVGRALYTLEQFTISKAKIFLYITNTCRGTKTKTSYFLRKKNIRNISAFSIAYVS